MSTLKQRLAQKLKKAIDEKRKKIQNQNFEQNLSEKKPTPSLNSHQFKYRNNLKQNLDQRQEEFNDILQPSQQKPQQEQKNKDQISLQVYSYKQQVLLKNPFIAQLQKIQEKQQDIQNQIKIMVEQKQSRKKEDQQQRKKQLLLNTLKNKKKPRPPKPMDRPTPFNQLSPPYQQIKIFASYLRVYQERRRRQLYSTIVDLGVKTLQQVIVQCLQEGIISKNFIKQIKKTGAEMEIDFVKKFSLNKLDEYDFKATKFTPLDHRGLCGLLLKHDKKYILGERIYCVFKQITDFYEVIYSLEQYQYQKLCEAIRIKYKLTWRESSLKNIPPINDDELNKFDTSSIFQLRPSPTFGAELQNQEKQFFKAKRQKYPQRFKNTAPIKKQSKPQNKPPKAASIQKSSDQQSQSYDSSNDSIIDKDIDDEEQSEIVPSSIYKTSSLKSSIKKSKLSHKKQNDSNSESMSYKSSEVISQVSNQSNSNQQQQHYKSGQRSQSNSMYKSKSKSVSKRNKKDKIKEKKSQIINRSQSYLSRQGSSFDQSQLDQIDNANIFQDYDQDIQVDKQTKKVRK